MKVNLAIILESIDSLRAVSEHKFPGNPKLTWDLAKVLKKCESIVKHFGEVRDKLVRQFGTKAEDGKTIMVTPENQQAFVDEIALLLKQEIEIKVQPFKIEEVNRNGGIEPKHLAAISWLFGEEGDEDSGIDVSFIQDRTETTIVPTSTPSPESGPVEVIGDSSQGEASETEVINVGT